MESRTTQLTKNINYIFSNIIKYAYDPSRKQALIDLILKIKDLQYFHEYQIVAGFILYDKMKQRPINNTEEMIEKMDEVRDILMNHPYSDYKGIKKGGLQPDENVKYARPMKSENIRDICNSMNILAVYNVIIEYDKKVVLPSAMESVKYDDAGDNYDSYEDYD